MKLICPKCKAGVKIGGASRFREFTCRKCNHTFMGLEAEVGFWSVVGLEFMMTGCLYCWTPLELRSGGDRGGYIGPQRCYSCCRKLPRRPDRFPGTEWETNYEMVARTLNGYSCSVAKGNELLQRIESLSSEFSPVEVGQLKQMVQQAVRRGGGG
jgi:hypothetical protein